MRLSTASWSRRRAPSGNNSVDHRSDPAFLYYRARGSPSPDQGGNETLAREEGLFMRDAAADLPISSLVISWVLIAPLACFAVSGLLWFRSGAIDSNLSATYGSLATGTSDTVDNVAVTIAMFSVIPLIALPKCRAILKTLQQDRLFALLAIWIFLSCSWSQFPLVSLQWAPVAALNIFFAFYFYERFRPDQQIRLLFLFGWFCLILSIILSLFFPRYGIDHTGTTAAWRGMYPQKNMCSMVTVFLVPSALYLRDARMHVTILRFVYVASSIFVIAMTRSATGLITLTCLLIYFVLVSFVVRFRSRGRTILLILGLVLAVASAVAGLFASESIASFFGKDPTLTGRTEIWHAVLPSIMKRPILGYGYNSFWRGYQGEAANVSLASHWAVPSAHNGFLEVWLTLGGVGLALVLYSLARASGNAFLCLRKTNSSHLKWYVSLVVLTFITSSDEGILATPNSFMWILYMIACIGLSRAAARIREDPSHA